jgi:recombination protein RecA
MASKEDAKSLDSALKQLSKLGISMQRLGDRGIQKVPTIPTGSIVLNRSLGIGGYLRGRLVEVYGQEMSGKTTISMIGMAQAQKMGGTVAFIDAEHAFDPFWAEKLGVKVDDVLINQPDYGEAALETICVLAQNNAVDMIVLDSTAALVPKAELEGTFEDNKAGLAAQARMLSQTLRKLTTVVGKSKACVIFINQLREKPGVMFGDPNTTPGGKALKFYSSVRLKVTRLTGKANTYLDENKEIVGNRIRIKVSKNKLAVPFKTCEFDLFYTNGIDVASEIPQLAIDMGLIQKSGRTYTYKEYKWLGMDQVIDGVKELPAEEIDYLKEKILNVDQETQTESVPESPGDGD